MSFHSLRYSCRNSGRLCTFSQPITTQDDDNDEITRNGSSNYDHRSLWFQGLQSTGRWSSSTEISSRGTTIGVCVCGNLLIHNSNTKREKQNGTKQLTNVSLTSYTSPFLLLLLLLLYFWFHGCYLLWLFLFPHLWFPTTNTTTDIDAVRYWKKRVYRINFLSRDAIVKENVDMDPM